MNTISAKKHSTWSFSGSYQKRFHRLGSKELGLTQPTDGKIINDIEAYFGTELVVQNTGVTLIPVRCCCPGRNPLPVK
ncbi:hypothetical protein DMH17_11440 [Raoultella planticola]|nr:hypothetical protein [Raoultella planticola]